MDYTMISIEAERALIARAQSGDRRAQGKLVEAFRPLVLFYAERRVGYGIDRDDLVQEANIGLLHAMAKFDPNHGNRFGAYARWWVIAAVDMYTCRNWSNVRQIKGGKVKGVHEAIGANLKDLSMDFKLPGGEQWGNTLADPAELQDVMFDNSRERATWLAELERRMEVLTPRERVILKARWPDAEESIRLEVIGHFFGLTRERIRQIEAKALEKMGLKGLLHNQSFVVARKQRMVG